MDSNGWELHKENIQPLSSGRNVSLLKDSLDTSSNMVDHEKKIDTIIKDMELKIHDYKGDDPIEPHINLIHFLENQCLQSLRLKGTLANARLECFRTFFQNENYINDRRFIDVMLKAFVGIMPEPSQRLGVLQKKLSQNGVGTNVAQMYIAIADLQESLGKSKDALQTLKSGITANAQPIERIQEAHGELECRIVTNSMNSLAGQTSAVFDQRNFGAAVPVYGSKNDATVFRNDLPPAIPVPVGEQRNKLKPPQVPKIVSVPVFQENENAPATSHFSEATTTANSSGKVIGNLANGYAKTNKENELKPSKWNRPELTIGTESEDRPLFDAPREKLTLFTEDAPIVISKKAVIGGGVLKEWKDAQPVKSDLLDSGNSGLNSQSESKSYEKQQTASFNSSMIGVGLGDLHLELVTPPSIPNSKLMSKIMLLPCGDVASSEHFMRNRWLKNHVEKEQVAKLNLEKADLLNKMYKIEIQLSDIQNKEESWREKFETALKRLRELEAVERGLRAQNENMEQDFKDRLDELNNLLSRKDEEKENAENRIDELQATVEHLQSQLVQLSNGNSTNNNGSNSGPSSASNSSASYLARPERSHHVTILTDKLLDGTTQSPDGYCGAPEMSMSMALPSMLKEQTFNESVKMAGTTTVFGWRDDNTRFNFDDSPVKKDESVAEQRMEMLPPPLPASRKIAFTLYESHLDSQSMTKSRPVEKSMSKPQQPSVSVVAGVNFKTLSENVAPLPPPVSNFQQPSVITPAAVVSSSSFIPISHRKTEIIQVNEPMVMQDPQEQKQPQPRRPENTFAIPAPATTLRESLEKGGNTVGQSFPAPTRRYRPSIRPATNNNDDEDEPGFEPFVPLPGQPRYGEDLDFDVSNLTSALAFGPQPLLNSTPQRNSTSTRLSSAPVGPSSNFENFNSVAGNYFHTQKLPSMQPKQYEFEEPRGRIKRTFDGQTEGPMSPDAPHPVQRGFGDDYWAKYTETAGGRTTQHQANRFTQRLGLEDSDGEDQQNPDLSTIQETSKENRSSCTTGSSSSHSSTRGGATMSGTNSIFYSNSRSVSGDHLRSANKNGQSRYQ